MKNLVTNAIIFALAPTPSLSFSFEVIFEETLHQHFLLRRLHALGIIPESSRPHARRGSRMSSYPLLSKTRYISGLQCHLRLWNDTFARGRRSSIADVAARQRPAHLGQPDATLQAIFDTGTEVGELACKRHPGGVLIGAQDHLPASPGGRRQHANKGRGHASPAPPGPTIEIQESKRIVHTLAKALRRFRGFELVGRRHLIVAPT